MTFGILNDRLIGELIERGAIRLQREADRNQIQPASLDLRLGAKAHRVRASFLPGGNASVADKLARFGLHEIDLTAGAVLETGCVYIVPLMESLALPADVAAAANPKSSTGRLDIFTRVITDRAQSFDLVAEGYEGPLYLEVSPRTFPIVVRQGSRLTQMRFRRGHARLDEAETRALHEAETLVAGEGASITGAGIAMSIDLEGTDGLVGYRAKRHAALVDVDRPGAHAVADYWERLDGDGAGGGRELVLDPDEFYILVSREAIHVPPSHAAEMVPFDPLVGEFRVHYAGFFDPGFGHAEAGGRGARAVLEVRSHEVPFILEHGQIVGRLAYEAMIEAPEALYGAGLSSNYQAQGLKLSKHFRT